MMLAEKGQIVEKPEDVVKDPYEELTNNWHEFIEYGTSNKIRIILQRSGYKRESAYYIRQHADKYIRRPADNPKLLLKALLESPNELLRIDTEEIQYSVPELFIGNGEK